MPQAKTIKQAKAAYKSRAEQPLTEREKKQLERAVQLERRAWGLREREKNKLDLAKKRVAQEKAQKDEERRIGTQRRNDKFGFKSSQFHLGAFFRRPNAATTSVDELRESKDCSADGQSDGMSSGDGDKATGAEADGGMDGEEDEYEGVDDESLLQALHSPEVMRFTNAQVDVQTKPDMSMPPPPRPNFVQSTNKPPLQSPVQAGPDLEWHDFLESSTQIARELGLDASMSGTIQANAPAENEISRTGSFSSDSFELTEDDLEQLDPTPRARTRNEQSVECTKTADDRMKMPPPPLPIKPRSQTTETAALGNDSKTTRLLKLQDDMGFSMTQLESFVDDDLQLTQSP
jgi:hypothetical protein